MANEVGILSIIRTSPHEYDFEIALSEPTDSSRIHDLVLTATVQGFAARELDFGHEEERILCEAQDCIAARLEKIRFLKEERKQSIILAYEKQNALR